MAPVGRPCLDELLSPRHAALLVIDVQRDLCPPDYAPMLARLARVLEAARAAGVLVMYVQNVVLPGGASHSPAEISRRCALGLRLEYTLKDSPGAQFMDAVAPRPGEPVVTKHRLNAFEGTSLDMLLRSRAVQMALNYHVIPVSDCVASWQQALHEASLLVMRHTMHRVVDSAQLLSAWRGATVH